MELIFLYQIFKKCWWLLLENFVALPVLNPETLDCLIKHSEKEKFQNVSIKF